MSCAKECLYSGCHIIHCHVLYLSVWFVYYFSAGSMKVCVCMWEKGMSLLIAELLQQSDHSSLIMGTITLTRVYSNSLFHSLLLPFFSFSFLYPLSFLLLFLTSLCLFLALLLLLFFIYMACALLLYFLISHLPLHLPYSVSQGCFPFDTVRLIIRIAQIKTDFN